MSNTDQPGQHVSAPDNPVAHLEAPDARAHCEPQDKSGAMPPGPPTDSVALASTAASDAEPDQAQEEAIPGGSEPEVRQWELPASDFTSVDLQVAYSSGEQPLTRFYVPLLARAVSYRRLVGYFSARVLARAAAGFAPFVARGGTWQLVVGAQLSDEDVDAVVNGAPLEDVVAARICVQPLQEGVDIIERDHLRLLAWMLQNDRLSMRVGVPIDRSGRPLRPGEARRYFHSKYGVFTDAQGQQVAFSGSDNETVAGWSGNHETFQVFWSWHEAVWPLYGEDIVRRLDRHWNGAPDAGWAVLPVPVAVQQNLVDILPPGWAPPGEDADPRLRQFDVPGDPLGGDVPPESNPAADGASNDVSDSSTDSAPTAKEVDADRARLIEILRAPLSCTMVGVASAPALPLPHQQRIAVRAVETYPRSYLLADEVGLGKTIEAGLILRELLLSERASTALLLVPASVLKQWQEELHEKIGLEVPRFEGGAFLDRHDQPLSVATNANPWSAQPVLLASSHLARRKDRRRQLLAAGPWDVVLLDEAHHARRSGAKATGTPNTLLALLHDMRRHRSWKALYLASATPMQMAPHEAWDLIELFGLPAAWGTSAEQFVHFFTQLRRPHIERDWALLCRMLRDQMAEVHAPNDERLRNRITQELGIVGSRTVLRLDRPPTPTTHRVMGWRVGTGELADEWLRAHTPMRDRVFRHTRGTMRRYQEQGLLPRTLVIPRRKINDRFIELSDEERRLYARIDAYISRYYNSYMNVSSSGSGGSTARALGFIMTVYRRRLTSSFYAVCESLKRRRNALAEGKAMLVSTLLDVDDRDATEDDEAVPESDNGSLMGAVASDQIATLLARELKELDSFIADIDVLGGRDTKADRFEEDLQQALSTDGYDSAVIFTQYTDTMDFLRQRLISSYGRVACYSGRGGEQWDQATGTWSRTTKAELKQRFRDGEIRILLGTDSMSEGLNLQTCGKLFNYDMPWNLMRVEQRIGRVDRIGATFEEVTISNYYYAGTVEQSIYSSIKSDFGDFTEIIGDAQPVLAATEEVVRKAALAATAEQARDAVTAGVQQIREQVRQATSGAVRLSDAEEDALTVPELHPSATLKDLATVVERNAAIPGWFTPDSKAAGVYWLRIPGRESVLVTFERSNLDSDSRDVALFTWGSSQAHDLYVALKSATVGTSTPSE